MSTQELFVQQFTGLFHYQRDISSETERDSEPRNSLSLSDHNRLVGATRRAILELETTAILQEERRRYFAKSGEAEWGELGGDWDEIGTDRRVSVRA